jgi:hypothetical protein
MMSRGKVFHHFPHPAVEVEVLMEEGVREVVMEEGVREGVMEEGVRVQERGGDGRGCTCTGERG